jgi:hypothetical protein
VNGDGLPFNFQAMAFMTNRTYTHIRKLFSYLIFRRYFFLCVKITMKKNREYGCTAPHSLDGSERSVSHWSRKVSIRKPGWPQNHSRHGGEQKRNLLLIQTEPLLSAQSF